MDFHLTTHSTCHLQEALLLPDELVQAAHARGSSALGLTLFLLFILFLKE
jgi:hypothetical protein